MNYKNKEWLRSQYYVQGKSLNDIASMSHVNIGTILYWFEKFNIKRRSQKEGASIWSKVSPGKIRTGSQSSNWKGGVSRGYARKKWKEYHNMDIPRGFCVHHADGNKKNNSKENLMLVKIDYHSHYHSILRFGDRLYRNKEWLISQYKTNRMSTVKISEICNCSPATANKWLREFGVKIRPARIIKC